MANLLALPKTRPTPTIVPLVLIRQPWVPPRFALVTPPFFFQSIPPILVLLESTTLSISRIQDLLLVMNNQIVQRLWEQSPPKSTPSMDNPMDIE